MPKGKELTRSKAKEILSHGEVRGRKLTKKQRGFIGAVAGGNARKMHNPHEPYGDNAAVAASGSTPQYSGKGRNILNP